MPKPAQKLKLESYAQILEMIQTEQYEESK